VIMIQNRLKNLFGVRRSVVRVGRGVVGVGRLGLR
jgi:hypothetical protein